LEYKARKYEDIKIPILPLDVGRYAWADTKSLRFFKILTLDILEEKNQNTTDDGLAPVGGGGNSTNLKCGNIFRVDHSQSKQLPGKYTAQEPRSGEQLDCNRPKQNRPISLPRNLSPRFIIIRERNISDTSTRSLPPRNHKICSTAYLFQIQAPSLEREWAGAGVQATWIGVYEHCLKDDPSRCVC
jgi:hypothetical protein